MSPLLSITMGNKLGLVRLMRAFWVSLQYINSALGLENEILKLLETESTSIHRCQALGYDSASEMSGAYSGI